MRNTLVRFAVLAGLLSTPATNHLYAQASGTTAFVRFNVVPMTRDTVLRDQTVLVTDGRITAIGPSKTVHVPRGATRVDGGGAQFLVPALADMHTHTAKRAELALFASHGVLTILNLGWSPDSFVALERRRYNSGELFGPTVFEGRRMNWPWGRTSGISTIAQGRDTVRHAKRLGYDFIKVYTFLADTVFDAIMQESAAQGITVVGHQTQGIGLERAFRSGLKMVVHAEELRPTMDGLISSERADSLVRLFQEFGVWLTPTLSTFQAITNTWANPARLEQYITEGIAEHIPDVTVNAWRRTNYHTQTGSVANRLASYTEITRRLHRAGVPMLAGTDGPGIPGMIPGVAIHDELVAMQAIGMTTYEALATATSNAGRFITTFVPGATPFGTVSVGARADLLVLPANPLEDLRRLRTPSAVVRLGRVYSASQLDSIRVARTHP
jgi:imidazolonepropionase-like amidohydrolase